MDAERLAIFKGKRGKQELVETVEEPSIPIDAGHIVAPVAGSAVGTEVAAEPILLKKVKAEKPLMKPERGVLVKAAEPVAECVIVVSNRRRG